MSETIADVRTHLFAALRGLTDPEKPMEIDRARAIADVAQTIVNSAKVEVDFMKATGSGGSGFIPELPAPDKTIIEQRPGVTVRRHTLKG